MLAFLLCQLLERPRGLLFLVEMFVAELRLARLWGINCGRAFDAFARERQTLIASIGDVHWAASHLHDEHFFVFGGVSTPDGAHVGAVGALAC